MKSVITGQYIPKDDGEISILDVHPVWKRVPGHCHKLFKSLPVDIL
jgi:hypothetical protein